MNINWTEVAAISKETCLSPEAFWLSSIIFGILFFSAAIELGVFKNDE